MSNTGLGRTFWNLSNRATTLFTRKPLLEDYLNHQYRLSWISACPRSKKKSALNNDWQNILAYWEGPQQMKALKRLFHSINGWWVWGQGQHKTFCNLYPHLYLETILPALKLR